MPSLSDHIDRLTQTAKSIRTAATSTSASPQAPFTQAVLATPLGDLIRDIDPSELGLFTLVPPDDPTPAAPAEVTRIEVVSATPLRKHPARRDDNLLRPREPEPEVYAEAAIKYLDRYATIRPMPRARSQVAAMLEQLQDIRENMRMLNVTLQQTKFTEPVARSQSPKSLAGAEEQRIQDLQAQIEKLQKRKFTLERKRVAPKPRPPERPPVASPVSPSDPQEETFWNTPAAPARILQFTNELLMDEQVDVGDITSSFASPVGPLRPLLSRPTVANEDDDDDGVPERSFLNGGDEQGDETVGLKIVDEDDSMELGDEDAEDEDEKTVMFRKLSPSGSVPPSETDASTVEIEPPASPQLGNASAGFNSPPQSAKKQKVRITNEVERIIAKIWATVGDVIMPGHPFNVSGAGAHKPPRAKETIAHLHTLSSQAPAPSSPTGSSLSGTAIAPTPGGPTTQQILTAHMLLALLAAPPNFSLPLNRLKEAIGGKAGAGSGQVPTRVLYGCVAKRLVRIDRGGGEQVVRFDV